MPEWIMLRLKDFYKDAVGETDQVLVSEEVYELLANVFRREAHAQQMKDARNRIDKGYLEGNSEVLMLEAAEDNVEDLAIRHLELEVLQKAMRSLTDAQRQRLYLYYFEGRTVREIAQRQHVSSNAVWKSINGALEQIRQFFV